MVAVSAQGSIPIEFDYAVDARSADGRRKHVTVTTEEASA